MVLEGGRVGFTNFSAGIMVVDPRTDEYRPSTTQDVADLALMTDYLSEMDTCEHPVEGRDAPEETLAVRDAAIALKNTTKCVGTGALSDLRRRRNRAHGAPPSPATRTSYASGRWSTSPSARSARSRSRATPPRSSWAQRGTASPITSPPWRWLGASSPVTLAGTLVIHNCGGAGPASRWRSSPSAGRPASTARRARPSTCGLRQHPWARPSSALLSASVAQLAQRYMLPSFVAGL